MLSNMNDGTELDGFKVIVMDELRERFPDKFNEETGAMDYKWFEDEIRPKNFIYVRKDKNSLSFTLQNGSSDFLGVNGCEITAVIAACVELLRDLNCKFPSRERSIAITKLEESYSWLKLKRDSIVKKIDD